MFGVNTLMALPSLDNIFISDSYSGLLHTSAQALDSSTFQKVYDGSGNESTLKLSQSAVKINNVQYPTSDGTNRQFIKTDGSGVASFDDLSVSDLPDLDPDPSGSYTSIDTVVVNSKGLVTSITEFDNSDDDQNITITQTRYRTVKDYIGDSTESPISGVGDSTHINDSSWKFIDITDYVPSTTKTMIGFIDAHTDSYYRATVYASRTASAVGSYPILTVFGESSGYVGGGCQFTTRLGLNGNRLGFWLKITEGEITDLYVRLYLLGFQE